MKAPVLDAGAVTLGPLDPEAGEGPYADWVHDPAVTAHLELRFAPPDRAALARFIADQHDAPDSILWGIFLPDGRHVGNIKLGPIDARHGRAEVGLMIGAAEARGRGVGPAAIKAVTDYAFGPLGLSKVTAGCYSSNRTSERAFLKAGWRREGLRLRHFRQGDGMVDLILLARFRDDA